MPDNKPPVVVWENMLTWHTIKPGWILGRGIQWSQNGGSVSLDLQWHIKNLRNIHKRLPSILGQKHDPEWLMWQLNKPKSTRGDNMLAWSHAIDPFPQWHIKTPWRRKQVIPKPSSLSYG